MNGFINVLKPPGMTSFDVVAYLRNILKQKKAGHAGTLDPGASGVLLICLGKATKTIEYLSDMKKVYRVELTLGISTDSLDSYGNVSAIKDVNITNEQIIKTINSFVGEIEQIPPMYSAVKIDGERLYKIARKGNVVERKPRKVIIYSIEIIKISKNKVLFDVVCSKGTYIRTLCSSIGEKLGCGGHMSFLIRKSIGDFTIDSAYTLEEILDMVNKNKIHEIILNFEIILKEFKNMVLDKKDLQKFINGCIIPINMDLDNLDDRMQVKVYDESNNLFGIGEIIKENEGCYLKSRKLLK